MASSAQKKNGTSKKSGNTRSGTKRTGGSRSKKSPPPKRPIRREVGGAVLMLLALCVAVSYVGVSALFLDWLALLLKGLIGYGYWLAAPALLLAGLILVFHRGRPVCLRVGSALALPVLFGALGHLLLVKVHYQGGFGILGKLWSSGTKLHSGGAISGLLAGGSAAVLSKVVSVILFAALFVVLGMVALQITVESLVERYRNRPIYEEEPEPERREPIRSAERPRRSAAERSHTAIDIPLDGEERPAPPPPPVREPGRFTSFFRHKSPQQRTPDQVLMEGSEELCSASAARAAAPVSVSAPTSAVTRSAPVQEQPPESPVEEPPKKRRFLGIPAIPAKEPSAAPEPHRPEPEPMPTPTPMPVAAAPEPMPVAAAPVVPASQPPVMEMPPVSEAGGTSKKALSQEVAAQTVAVTAEIAENLAEDGDAYRFPPMDLLFPGQEENHIETGAELRNNSRRLEETLTSFGVDATAGDVIHGPSVTRYEFVLDQGVKLSKITNLSDDIALALGASGVRIAPIPGKISVVGIEVPNQQVTPVLIRDVIESEEFANHKSTVAFALGKDIGGRCIVGDIGKLPHVLIAGTTGSGKSVCTNSLIVSLLYKSTPEEVRFIMVDPKMVELAPYNGIPHLLIPVVTDPKKAAGALQWAVFEMMKRYKLFSEHGVKKLEEYNALARTREDLETIPSVVVVIDELADLMLVAAKEVEESICRVAQMGRAAGMHLVIATQRPSADVITGLMKANIPSRIAFAVASSLESRIILDTTGAEKLVGKGDMLYAPLGMGKPTRVQGCFISPEEIERVVAFVKETGEANYDDEVIAQIEESVQEKDKGSGKSSAAEHDADAADEMLPAAVEVILETGQASVSMLQRRLKLGYSRAARLVDQMEDRGIVGPFEGSKPRQLLITRAQWEEMQMGGVPSAGEEPAAEEPPFPMDEP